MFYSQHPFLPTMIRLLAEDLRCRLRSGVAITSVVQCVEELLLNSLDAGATCIAVRVDLDRMKVQVVDNGCGLCREDVERLGRRYFTSKCHSAEDLDDLRSYGFRGEAIASMVDVSSVVEVCSKRRGTAQTFSRLFHNGKPLEVVEAESSRPSAGTTVTLHNLFCNLPVRRKCLEPVVELERIRQRVEAVSLVKPAVSFSLRNEADHSVLLQLPKAQDTRSRFCQIYGLSRSQSLREALHTDGGFTMQGLVSCQGHYNRAMQFLYVNSRLVLKTKLHKLMDFIIRRESSICRGRGGRGAADLYAIFIVNIQCHVSEYDICLQPDKTLIEFQDWDRVMLCTERGLRTLLQRENLFLAPSKDDIDEFSQKHHYNLSCESAEQLVAHQGPGGGPAHPHDAANLRSKCVHRSSDITEARSPSPPLRGHNQLPGNIGSCDGAGTMEGGEVCDTLENEGCLTPPDTSTIPGEAPAGPMNEQIALSAPQYLAKPRGPVPAQRSSSGITPISADIAHEQASSERHGWGKEAATSLGGTLDRFRRRYGRGDGSEPQPCKSPEKTEAKDILPSPSIHKSPAEGATALSPPAPSEYVGLQQRDSQERTPKLSTKLCRLKRQTEAASWGGGCPLVPSAPSTGSPAQNQDGEWLQCYEESLGKRVFINSATGLSSYSAPPRDTTAACTTDVSNVAVTVVCSNGFQYQCHPFKSQTLIPFLPRDDRHPAGQTDDGGLSSLYTEWKNPVYVRHPALAVDVSRVHSDAQSVRIHNILYPYRFTKEMVHSMKVLQQVDSKFIVCLMNAQAGQAARSAGGHLLVLVDQHAAHERVRLEQLIADSFEALSDAGERRLKVSVVEPALEFHVSEEEHRVLRTRGAALRRVGLSLTFPDSGRPRVLLSEIPLCFVEREANELQRGRSPMVKKMVEEYLQEQVQSLQVPGAGHGAVPRTVLKVLASQACHGLLNLPQSSASAMSGDRDLWCQYRIGFPRVTEPTASLKGPFKRDYLVDAAKQLHVAQERDANEEYEAAFSHYKHGVELLLSGVTVDPSRERREAVKRKISQYLKRAEEIFNCHLQRPVGNVTGAAEGYSSLRFRPIRVLSAAVENLKGCRVLEIIDKVQLVYDPTSRTRFILKSLMKSGRCGHGAVTVIPQGVPFMVQLQKFYVGEDSLYLRLQHVAGGRLWGHLKKYQVPINHWSSSHDPVQGVPESQVRLWGAQLTLALDSLHQEGVLCRDLNPRNVLLGDTGDVLLTYFGQWREVDHVCCPEAVEQLYVAPEVLGVAAVDEACDWWSLGVLLYEMMTGQPLYKTLMSGVSSQMEVPFPEQLSADAVSLLKALLIYDPEKRLGSGPGGAQRIKSHPFFSDIHWGKLF